MAAAQREIPKLSGSRSGVLLLRQSRQDQIEVQTGSFSRSLARCSYRSKHGSDHAASAEFMRGRSHQTANYSSGLLLNGCSALAPHNIKVVSRGVHHVPTKIAVRSLQKYEAFRAPGARAPSRSPLRRERRIQLRQKASLRSRRDVFV